MSREQYKTFSGAPPPPHDPMLKLSLLTAPALALLAGGCALLEPLPPAAEVEAPLRLDWLSGSWAGADGELRWEEHWTLPAGGSMFGVGREIRGDRTTFFEYLRIELRADGVFYVVAPNDGPPVEFELVESDTASAVFENPDNSFPSRITYWRVGNTLNARLRGERDGEKGELFVQWERVLTSPF